MSWRYAGDTRALLLVMRTGLLQLAHPGLGAAVEQHSTFFNEPWQRLARSIPQIQDVIFDWPQGELAAGRIRDFHKRIKGTDAQGQWYHALSPEVFFWAHATIFDAMIAGLELFGRPLKPAQREALYAESCQLYQAYGVSDRVVPADYGAFRRYFSDMCAHGLERTRSAETLATFAEEPPDGFPLLPDSLYRKVRKHAVKPARLISLGSLPAPVRDLLGLSWTATDQRGFDRIRACLRFTWRALPHRLRYSVSARNAFARHGIGPTGRSFG